MSAFKSLLLVLLGFFAALGVLPLTQGQPALAQPGVSAEALMARLKADEAAIAVLQVKTAPIAVSGKDLTLTGVNVHIVDGSGSTSGAGGANSTGLGNLIIGYNAPGNFRGDVRTGSHNLILGDRNSYSSYGGLVVGVNNSVNGPYACVTGGYKNTAGEYCASITGGYFNKAGYLASVSGGNANRAWGYAASVSGGQDNAATGNFACVGGGKGRTSSKNFGWIAGSQTFGSLKSDNPKLP